MSTVVIVGAGPLGGAVASSLALRECCSRIVLCDPRFDVAARVAMDVAHACPVTGSDTRVTWSRLEAIGAPQTASGGAATPMSGAEATVGTVADVLVFADSGETGAEWAGESGLALASRVLAVSGRAPAVFAGAAQVWLLERSAAELGRTRESVLGTAALAFEAGVRTMLALEADAAVSQAIVRVVGRPPREAAVLWESATVAGEPALERLDAAAVRRIEARLPALWPPGPHALGSAAAAAVAGIVTGAPGVLTCLTVAAGTNRAVALPARLGRGGVRRAWVPRVAGRAAWHLG